MNRRRRIDPDVIARYVEAGEETMDLLEKMATFVRVVEAGSFSAAAKQLRLSGAAVSRQIQTLEEELRAQLIRRTTRSMSITPAGRAYYERCLHILRAVDDAQSIGRTTATAGALTVSAPFTFAMERIVPHVSTYMTEHSGMRVNLRLEDRLVDLTLEGVDVAIRVGNLLPDRTDIVAHELMSYRRVIVAAPAYLRRNGEPKTPEALAKHSAIAWTTDAMDTWTLSDKNREARVSLNVMFRSNAPAALKALAIDGIGIAMLPAWFVENELDSGSLRLLLPSWETSRLAVHALHRREDRAAARIRSFVEHLRTAYEQQTDS